MQSKLSKLFHYSSAAYWWSSDYGAAEAEQVLRQILPPTKTLDKKNSTLDEVQRWLQRKPQRKFPGEPVREPWCPALISVVCLFLFVTSRSTWMFLSLEPSVFWHIEFSHSSLWKEINNSFIYSTMSAASAAKLPFPFCRIPLSRSFLILYPLEIPLIYFYFLSNFHFAFYLPYSYGSFNIFQIIL